MSRPKGLPPRPISARRLAANRANAQKSTGPRTAHGKAISAANARRHGLSVPGQWETGTARAISAQADALAGPNATPFARDLAQAWVEAEFELARVLDARDAVWRDWSGSTHAITLALVAARPLLDPLARYLERARSRCRRARRAFDTACDEPLRARLTQAQAADAARRANERQIERDARLAAAAYRRAARAEVPLHRIKRRGRRRPRPWFRSAEARAQAAALQHLKEVLPTLPRDADGRVRLRDLLASGVEPRLANATLATAYDRLFARNAPDFPDARDHAQATAVAPPDPTAQPSVTPPHADRTPQADHPKGPRFVFAGVTCWGGVWTPVPPRVQQAPAAAREDKAAARAKAKARVAAEKAAIRAGREARERLRPKPPPRGRPPTRAELVRLMAALDAAPRDAAGRVRLADLVARGAPPSLAAQALRDGLARAAPDPDATGPP